MSHLPSNQSSTQAFPERVRGWAAYAWPERMQLLINSRRLAPTLLALILLVAAAFRLTGVNWDSGKHLHPDERFLTSMTYDIKWPENLDNYFDPLLFSLSPYSLQNMGLYVYGTVPPWLVKAVAIALNQDSYDSVVIVGRVISALFDLASIWVLFLFGRRLYGQWVGLLGAGLLGLSVMNIQQSHFYTTDTFANLFVVLTMLFALWLCEHGRWRDYALVGLALGTGLACKFSVVTLAAPILLAVGWDLIRRIRAREDAPILIIERVFLRFMTLVLLAGLTFRILQPISFEGPEFWNMSLNQLWYEDITEQGRILAGEVDAPPWIQWANRSALGFPLENILLWGLGPLLGSAAWAGWGLAAYELFWRKRWLHLLPLVYVGVTFLYHGSLFVKFMRYFLPIYPFLALFAAYLLVWLFHWLRSWLTHRAARSIESADSELSEAAAASPPRPTSDPRRVNLLASLPIGLVVLGTLIWAIAFTSIYTRPHTRVEASRWLIANLPPGAIVANEHWDDWLPVAIDGIDMYGTKLITGAEVPNFDDDTPDKLNRLVDVLSQSNYVSLSSNRLYDSIPRMPMRYPMATRYYELLLSEQLGYKRVAEFTSYPTFLGIQFPDQSAEEAFTVYDHPRVQIFQRQPDFNPERVREQLSAGIDFDQVTRLLPKQATAAPTLLQLTSAERDYYSYEAARQGPAPWAALASSLPLLFWPLALLLIGLAALPLTLVVFGNLRDRGYLLARTIGLLVVAWLAWILASAKLLPFTWWSLLLVLLLLAALSWAIGYRRRMELLAFWRSNGNTLLIQELVFWSAFLLFTWVRWQNPDLWHPATGGEKPMDVAYLTAISQTPFFPSYDPWYAGGFINYYYFGFVLIASLIHLTGIPVTTAYNLAVPTLYALTVAGAFVVVANLVPAIQPNLDMLRGRFRRALAGTHGWLVAGVLGSLFVTTLGNLGQVQLFWDGLKNLSTIKPAEAPPPQAETLGLLGLFGSLLDRLRELLLPIPQVLDGLMQVLFNNRELGFRQEWWYWNATRIIPVPKDAMGAALEAGPINEFPLFTFLFADLHAHMMALPLTVLVLAICVNYIRSATRPVELDTDLDRPIPGGMRSWLARINLAEIGSLGLAALTIGALWPTNTWDFPTYAVVLAGALGVWAYSRAGGVIDSRTIWAAGWRWALVVGLGFALFLPFHDSSASAYFGAEQWKGSHTPLWAYLLMHGFFLFILGTYLVNELLYGSNLNSPARMLALFLRYRRSPFIRTRIQRLVRPQPMHELIVMLWPGLVVLLGLLVVLGHAVVAVALLLSSLALLLFFSPHPQPERQFLLGIIAIAALLTAAVELVVLKGDISRMNTVFKFYLQVWVLWAIASAAVLPSLATRLGVSVRADAPPRRQPVFVQRWWRVFGLLLVGCLLYTLTAIPGRIDDRFEGVAEHTLDGTVYMRTAIHREQDQPVMLEYDREAIAWMRANLPGLPVIVEAQLPLYRWGSRVAIYTGLPTVIGWDWHQKQQRAILPGEYIDRRIEHVRSIYADPNPEVARKYLRLYNVEFIYVGRLEQIYYGPDGLQKFEQLNGQLWDRVYDNPEVQIYRVRQGI